MDSHTLSLSFSCAHLGRVLGEYGEKAAVSKPGREVSLKRSLAGT